ncbi:MAG: GTP-binding protein, partial [Spirochaetia bacterium]|nr:GTP-binding protein [Spirochaetia bacterium]
RLLDTAGIRRKSHVTEDVEYYSVNRAIAAIEDADVALLLIDAAGGLAEQDKKIAYQIVKKGRGIILVLNKWDLAPRGKKALREAAEKIRFQFPVLDFAPVLAVSAKTGWNVEALLEKAAGIHEELCRRVETGVLNRALGEWTVENPPPRDGRRRYKTRFITQVCVKPVKFILFVNRKEGFPSFYALYIKNKLRGLGFEDIPIDLELRTREKQG